MKSNMLLSAENALKNVYLGVIENQIDNYSSPFLAKVKQSTSDVYGKEVLCLPSWYSRYKEAPLLKKHLETYSIDFMLSEKAIRVAENNTGAFVNLLNAEMESLIKNSQKICRMNLELATLKELFTNKSKMLYNCLRSKYSELNVQRIKRNKLNVKDFEAIVFEGEFDFIFAGADFYQKYLDSKKKEETIFAEGFGGIQVNDAIMIKNNSIPSYSAYCLNTGYFKIHKLCNWLWNDSRDGKVIRETSNNNYTGDLVKYMTMMCTYPAKQLEYKIRRPKDGQKLVNKGKK